MVRLDGKHLYELSPLANQIKAFPIEHKFQSPNGILRIPVTHSSVFQGLFVEFQSTHKFPYSAYLGVYMISYFLLLRQHYLFYVYESFSSMYVCAMHVCSP